MADTELDHEAMAATLSKWAREHKHVLAIFEMATQVVQLKTDLKDYALRKEAVQAAYETQKENLSSSLATIEAKIEDAQERLAAKEGNVQRVLDIQRQKQLNDYTTHLDQVQLALGAAQATLEASVAQTKESEAARIQNRLDAAEAKGEYEEYVAKLARAKQEALASLA